MTDWIIGSCILIAAVFLIRKLSGARISSRFRYALWAVVLIRLLCPAALWNNAQMMQEITKSAGLFFGKSVDFQKTDADISADNTPGNTDTQGENVNSPIEADADKGAANFVSRDDTFDLAGDSDQKQSAYPDHNENDQKQGVYDTENTKQNTVQYTRTDEIQNQKNLFLRCFSYVWLAGSIVVGLWLIGVNLHFCNMLLQNRKRIDKVPLQNGIRLPVYQVKNLTSPCLFGMVHPAVYLREESQMKEDGLQLIIEHEICHYRHKDHIWAVMRSICIAVWWWNPLVWAAAAASKRDCEMACDEGTLETIGWDKKFVYAKTLVDAVSDKRGFGVTASSTMVSGKSDTERRLRMMLNRKKTKMASVVLAAGLMVSASALCFGGESQTIVQNQSEEAESQVQGPLPVLSAKEVYEQKPTTDGVEEFCETYGLMNREYVAQITPEWMKETGIALFRDALNERVYLTWQDQMIVIPQLKIGIYISTSNMEVLSTALADQDEDGVYEVYLTGRIHMGGLQYTNMVGVARLTDMSFYWLSDVHEAMDGEQNALMLSQNESGELVRCRASFRKNDDNEEHGSSYKGPYGFSMTAAQDRDEQPVILSEENLVVQPSQIQGYPVGGQSTQLDTSGWLIPQGGPRWSWTLDELKAWYGDELEIVSEDDTAVMVQVFNTQVWGCNAKLTATVNTEVGVTGLDYEFAYEDRDTIVAKMDSLTMNSQTLGGTSDSSDGLVYSWEGKQAATFEAAAQKRYREICEQRGTWSDTKEKRYAHQVTAQMTITDDACKLSFAAEPEITVLYRDLLDKSSVEIEEVRELWNRQYRENGGKWELAWDSGLATISDYKRVVLEDSQDEPLHVLAQSLVDQAQPYPSGGFGESLSVGWSMIISRLRMSNDDLTITIMRDAYTGAGFLIKENGSGYVLIAVKDGDTPKDGLFSFASCDTGKELYRKIQEEINKSDAAIVTAE